MTFTLNARAASYLAAATVTVCVAAILCSKIMVHVDTAREQLSK